MIISEFDKYIVHGEPGQKEKADAWQTAIGLQDVDGLKVSSYLLDTARQHIEGDITIDEVRERIKAYYETKSGHDKVDEEGDKASANIAKIPSEPSFAFSLVGLTSIHRRIFEGVFKFAGQLRNVELSKKEWVLGGNVSVSYQPAVDLREAIELLVGASLPKSTLQSITMPNPKSQIDTLNCTLEVLAIIKIIEDNPKVTQTEIAKLIKKSSSTVKRITSSLVEKGVLNRRNGRRNGWWEITG